MAISHYSTYLKTQGYGSLTEYLVQCKPDNYYYDYWNYLSGWEESFPSSNFSVRVFDKKELVDGDVVADFCQAVGLDGFSLEDIESANESVTPTGQELLKVINKNFDIFINGVGLNSARIALVQIISRLFSGSGQKPMAVQAYPIQAQFDEINEKVRQRWFPEREKLFEISYEKFDQQETVNWDVVNFFESYVDEYVKLDRAKLAGIPPVFIDSIRDHALHFEASGDVGKALRLMRVANFLRPNGSLIRSKVKKYERDLLKPSYKADRPYYLSNEKRVSLYFDFGVNLSERDPEVGLGFVADRPFVFDGGNSLLGIDEERQLAVNYSEDLCDFLESVGCNDFLPVQFGDKELPEKFRRGLVFKKARRINGKGVLLNMNKKRHWGFSFGFDRMSWKEKNNEVVWRGVPTGIKSEFSCNWGNNLRFRFVKAYFDRYDVGFSKLGAQGDSILEPYVKGFLDRNGQLKSKFIVSLEGNDVATNLKWILASSSVPVMPIPTKESWLLESQLIPYVHYVPLNDSLDNLDEVYEWCLNNDSHCRQIAENGKRYMEMFFDEENEREIYRMIFQRYKKTVSG
ncbi:glycosyl transferase family 90 [Salinicola peritrichatus]|uniref:glycosyl transferase family 90 n=1 Tax=Salinicola peritrichatus TaxID=1267424 RepID=UPI0013A5F3E1|nr:glycosyl transferase family 90 [Salinicola peritrichatus]